MMESNDNVMPYDPYGFQNISTDFIWFGVGLCQLPIWSRTEFSVVPSTSHIHSGTHAEACQNVGSVKETMFHVLFHVLPMEDLT